VENVCSAEDRVADPSSPETPQRKGGVDSGLTAVWSRSVNGLLQEADLALVISVVLEQAPDQSPDGNSGRDGWIALVRDPANKIVGLEVIDRPLEILLS
jgi:hypothetical protein